MLENARKWNIGWRWWEEEANEKNLRVMRKNLINIFASHKNNSHHPSSDPIYLHGAPGEEKAMQKIGFLCLRELRYQNRSMVTRI